MWSAAEEASYFGVSDATLSDSLALLSAGSTELDALALDGGSLLDRGVSVLWERAGAAGSLLRRRSRAARSSLYRPPPGYFLAFPG